MCIYLMLSMFSLHVNFKGIKPHVRCENLRSNLSKDAKDLPQFYQYTGILYSEV